MMKKYFILAIFCLTNLFFMNGQHNYQEDWKKVVAFEQKGLPKSAIEVVKTIYTKAKKENNDPQVIKALLYKSKHLLTLEENAQLTIINDFKTEINESAFPKKNILESILANLYWQYFQQNRWKFYNRTKTAQKVDEEDFRSWDLDTLFEEIHAHFQKSIQNGVLAQQTDLQKFDDILNTYYDSKKYRPTLYDFLMHNALQFYKTSETSITKPSYAFRLDNPSFLSDHNTFSTLRIESKDTLSLQGNALKLYQDLIQFHKRDTTPVALTEVNIERLKFIYENAVFPGKQEVLLKTLQLEKEKHSQHQVSALYDFEIALLYKEQGSSYIPGQNETHRWRLKEALEICKNTIKKFPESRGADNCEALQDEILDQQLDIKTEKFVPIQTPGRLLVSYKNLNKLYFKALKITPKQLETLERIYELEKQIKFLNGLRVSTTWDAEIRDENDYQKHDTEVLLPELDAGFYLILATQESELSKETMFSYGHMQITDLSLIEHTAPSASIFQVLNRHNGAPVSNAKIHLKSSNQGYRQSLDKTIYTDANGQASLKLNEYYYDVTITVTHEKDKAIFEGYYLNRNYEPNQNDDSTRYSTFLFTDRSIYRPGQTVYFKGIRMSSKRKEDFKVVPNTSAFARLRDVNGQELETLQFTTNEYGSFAGEFILPSSGLTGLYTIQTDDYQSISFSVEEYKRPKFETTFNPVVETYTVNDTVKLTGTAKAYAGSNITDAKVVYRVHRKVQYPRWCYWFPSYNSDSQEIVNGETTTNKNGEYFINFKALPDPTVLKENQPIFNYEVTADVIDINGETRSTTTIVNVGYHSITAGLTINGVINKEEKDQTISVTTANLNGEAVAASGTIKIYKLEAPAHPLRKRPWAAPDYPGFEKEAFEKLFPHDAFKDEHDFRKWKKGTLVLNTNFNTNTTKSNPLGSQQITLGNIKKWESGKYVVELESKDPFGQAVKDIRYTTLYQQSDKVISDNQLFEITTDKSAYKNGDVALVKLSSASEDITVTIDIEKNYKIVETQLIRLSKNSKVIKIPVTKDDLGGFSVNYSFVNYNSYQHGVLPVAVPYEPTELSIETKTFRDKLQPGQSETWSFTIKGPKGDKVSAELLASMYDMSLDQFKPHQWYFTPVARPLYYTQFERRSTHSFGANTFRLYNDPSYGSYYGYRSYDQLEWFGLYFGQGYSGLRRSKRMYNSMEVAAAPLAAKSAEVADEAELSEVVVEGNEDRLREEANAEADQEEKGSTDQKDTSLEGVKIRKNLQETAFFLPQLTTDPEGNISFTFTAPEALTQWKLQLLAHTKEMNAGTQMLETVTQKELMVLPNPPRFLREGDTIVLSSKISNLSDQALNGIVELQLFDALTNAKIDDKLSNTNARQNFEVITKGNTNVSWKLQVPDDVQTVLYKIVAKAGEFSDGEQSMLPVLSNRMLVTETMPMWIRSNQSKTFTFDKLKNNSSNTLKHHKLTLEMTSNPAWYAVQALPYLMEYPYECSEQTFSRYYANALASHIANSTPRIQEVFNQWKSTDALLSNLEKNQELKSLIIQETPWLRDAQSETEQKKRIALLFDLNKMNNELQSALNKLKKMQYGSGAFPWFEGGRENRYITQHIITGFGHLAKLNVAEYDSSTKNMLQNAIRYLDNAFVKEYKELKRYCKKNKIDINKNHLSYTQIHYLYMRSFFPDIKRPNNTNEAWEYYMGQSKKYWLKQNLYAQGMLALVLHRNNDNSTATKIIRSLDERSINNEELGMYWKSNVASWYWYQAPIETQSLMIEVFSEVEKEPKRTEIVDNLKVWLLKNKQTNRWQTTKATADAVYALLLQGSDWISVTDMVDIVLGDQKIDPATIEDVSVEAGTGYFKTSWNGSEIQPNMATVQITKKGKGIAWGALYWQYFEDLDKITVAETPLSLKKKLFVKKNTDTGEEITEITDVSQLQLGDLVRVRIELRSDRTMEFVHMKDMRAAGFEPINVISQYKWQDGLGYYQSTRDAATNFFFDYLPKGVHVFEYDLRVNNSGDFSNGITTIQSMYAPEFTSHSEGIRVHIN